MRATILTMTFAAVLAMTTALPGRAQAQIIISPTVSGSPYVYPGYWSPGYNYNYAWTNPYYTTYQSYWGGPSGNYNWTWVRPNYYTTGYPWPWANYGRYWR